jgi:hypothetical protein
MADFGADIDSNDGGVISNGKLDSGSDAIVENIDSAAERFDNNIDNDAGVVDAGDHIDDTGSANVDDEIDGEDVDDDGGDDCDVDNGNNDIIIINNRRLPLLRAIIFCLSSVFVIF